MSNPFRDEQVRAVSWWIEIEDLAWPSQEVIDKVTKKADALYKARANLAIIFGAHFRWDFLYHWDQLHEYIAFVAKQLHQRNILLFDHHSSVLTHRHKTFEDRRKMLENSHHLGYLSPSSSASTDLTFNNYHLNDWRMIDLQTKKPLFLNGYMAEQFCINNPNFIESYQIYIKKLLKETNIDGLMSDDGIYYSGFTSCGCFYCQQQFQKKFNKQIPQLSNLKFWGNHDNPTFNDYIQLRYQNTRNYLNKIRDVLPKKFPLMTCCSSSINQYCTPCAMDYSNYLSSCNIVMLEMVGDTPKQNGRLFSEVSSAIHHIEIAKQKSIPCIGLGYGFSQNTGEILWGFNKFIGSGTWFSTLKGRLGIEKKFQNELPDEAYCVKRVYRYEEKNEKLFNCKGISKIAVYFSKNTRDYWATSYFDYVEKFNNLINSLFEQGYDIEIVESNSKLDNYQYLLIPFAVCISNNEFNKFMDWRKSESINRQILFFGLIGTHDENGRIRKTQILEKFGLKIQYKIKLRSKTFPLMDEIWEKGNDVVIQSSKKWHILDSNVQWHPCCPDNNSVKFLAKINPENLTDDISVSQNDSWYFKLKEDFQGCIQLHGICRNYKITKNHHLENKRPHNKQGISIIKSALPKFKNKKISISFKKKYFNVRLHEVLGRSKKLIIKNNKIEFNVNKNIFYWILSLGNN